MNVVIIGTGKMARGISTRLLMGGNHVSLVEHTSGKAQILVDELVAKQLGGSISASMPGTLPAEVVILAVPYEAVQSIMHDYIELLPGLILVDITNPINYQEMQPSTPPGSSGAEEIKKLAPINTRVVKAFNTTLASTLIEGKVKGIPLDVFLAGDDADAKSVVASLIEAGGLRALDAGPLLRARQLEALGLLHIALQGTLNTGMRTAIKLIS